MLIMEEVEKIVVDKMFTTLNEMISNAPIELHTNKETTFLFIPLYLMLLSRLENFNGYNVCISPYSNKIILSNVQNYCLIEQNF
jgi:hypothetical protein